MMDSLMALRLIASVNERTVSFDLVDGIAVVGSSADCAIQIGHPTVSRHHARIEVTFGEVVLTDLGSSNGTCVNRRRMNGPMRVDAGDLLRFGNVDARVVTVGDEDLEIGVACGHGVTDAKEQPIVGAASHSTVGGAALETFSLKYLPDLVDRLARGESASTLARAVGEALLHSLPCGSVEVGRSGAEERGVVFRGTRDRVGVGHPVDSDAGAVGVVSVEFGSEALAVAFRPVVNSAAGLIAAAERTVPGWDRSTAMQRPRSVAAAPDPPTLDPHVREIYQRAERIAPSRVSVLIRGESGTGKELLARFLHQASDRGDKPLVALNCAALPRDLLESELFGVERGVATGVDARAGKFEAAHGGTLFLDEIGDMAPETQARILRVLAEGEVYRVGAHAARPADVRVISATNRDIRTMVADGRFRADLFHRIADWVVEVPPLRERRADIPNLAAHFLERAGSERGVRPAGISRAAVGTLMAYAWPGNVRQLEREMGRVALFLDDGQLVESTHLQSEIRQAGVATAGDDLKSVLKRAETAHVQRILSECHGDVHEAASRLGIGVSTLYRRMRAIGVSVPESL